MQPRIVQMGVSGAHSAFRVGDDVELRGVLVYLSILILILALVEVVLHAVESHACNNKKSKEILGKIYRELMLLGIISFLSVLFAELGVIDKSTSSFLEFESAHLTIFFTAVMLTFQAICIYFSLQVLDFAQDSLEEMNLKTFLTHVEERNEQAKGKWFLARWYHNKTTEDFLIFKVFRSYFMSVHRLPVLFPFSKYLKQAQDSQVSLLIEIEPIIWVIHLVVWWLMFLMHSQSAEWLGYKDNMLYSMTFFTVFAVGLFLVHIFIIRLLSTKTDQLLVVAGCHSKAKLRSSIELYAWKEEQLLNSETHVSQTQSILAQMKQQLKFHQTKQKQKPTTGSSWLKKKSSHSPPSSPRYARPFLRRDIAVDLSTHSKMYFRPETVQGILKFILLGNAFFQAFYMVGYLHMTWQNFDSMIGIVTGLVFPIVLLLNSFILQPIIISETLVLASIWDVNSQIIGKLLDDMMDSVLMKEELGKRLYLRLQANGQDIDQLIEMVKEFDTNQDGCIDEDEMKQILEAFELHLSSFRFKALITCLKMGTGKIFYHDLYDMVKAQATNDDSLPEIGSRLYVETRI